MSNDDRKAYTVTTLAEAAGVNRSYIARLCKAGAIPSYLVGKQYVIPYNAGLEWLALRARKAEKLKP